MPSRILSIPLIIIIAVFGYFAWHGAEQYAFYALPFFLLLAIIYILAPQVDWWWYKQHPPDVDPPIRKMLEKTNSFYNKLSEVDQLKFRQRMALFVKGIKFMPKGWDKIPGDVIYAIAANAVQVHFNHEALLFEKYENVVVYPTPFPSPQYPKHFHPSEVFKEDGVLLFSARDVMYGSLEPKKYYNVALHEYIKVYMDTYPEKKFPVFTEADWPALGQVSAHKADNIIKTLNVPDIDPTVVAATLYQLFPAAFLQVFQKRGAILAEIFGHSL